MDLKNFEAVFAIMSGLESQVVQEAENAWQVSVLFYTRTFSKGQVNVDIYGAVTDCILLNLTLIFRGKLM